MYKIAVRYGSNLYAKKFVNMNNLLARKFWKNFGVAPQPLRNLCHFLKKKKLSILAHHLRNAQILDNQKCS